MRTPLSITLLVAAGLGISALATRLGDRQTMTPPPDAVLESFLRQIATARYDIAVRHLSASRAKTTDANMLKAWFDRPRARLGDIVRVDAETQWLNQEQSGARATVDGEYGSIELTARLVWDGEGWALDALPADAQLTVRPRAR